jgi:hypothetical protein
MAAFPDPPLAVARFTTNDDWSVDVADLAGTGQLRLRNPVGGWYLKAVTLEGKDITDDPLEFTGNRAFNDVQIVLTRKRSELSGVAVDARNEPATDYAAVLFAEERSEWTAQSRFIGVGRPDQQGHFRISGMPPGRYLAVAIDSLVNGEERDPDLLDRLQAVATRVTLADGESQSISLKVTAR